LRKEEFEKFEESSHMYRAILVMFKMSSMFLFAAPIPTCQI